MQVKKCYLCHQDITEEEKFVQEHYDYHLRCYEYVIRQPKITPSKTMMKKSIIRCLEAVFIALMAILVWLVNYYFVENEITKNILIAANIILSIISLLFSINGLILSTVYQLDKYRSKKISKK